MTVSRETHESAAPAQPNHKFSGGGAQMAEVLRRVKLTGFDPGGEPSVRVMSDGSLEIWFEFMPPSDVERSGVAGLGEFAAFDREITAAVGVPVVWEDREFFRIEDAPPGTLERVQSFVEGYRRRTEPGSVFSSSQP